MPPPEQKRRMPRRASGVSPISRTRQRQQCGATFSPNLPGRRRGWPVLPGTIVLGRRQARADIPGATFEPPLLTGARRRIWRSARGLAVKSYAVGPAAGYIACASRRAAVGTYPRPDFDLRRLSSTAMTGVFRTPTRVSCFAFLAENGVRSPFSTPVIFDTPLTRGACFACRTDRVR